MNKIQEFKLDDLKEQSKNIKLKDVAPEYTRRNLIPEDQMEKIIQTLSIKLNLEPQIALIGIYLLFLKGAASTGAPPTMNVELGKGIILEKRDLLSTCDTVTGHKYIRRIAETLARDISEFAYENGLSGELAYRINNKFKAETGESLNEKEMAFCNSFSQAIPELKELTSERLVKLLAEDYQRRFENKKKTPQQSIQNINSSPKNKKKKKK